MRVLMISANVAQTPYPVYPLGASVVMRALREAGHEAELFDFLHHGCSMQAVVEALKASQPDVVGISMRNLDNVNMLSEQRYLASVRDMVEAVREHTSAPVVVGGSGYSVAPDAILPVLGADYGISGEGERAMVELVDAIAAGAAPAPCGIDGGKDLLGSDMRPADYDDEVLRFYLSRGNTASVQTKRGCKYHCIYCSYPLLEGHVWRSRPAADVVDDIERLVGDHGAECVFFTDSVFNDDKGQYLEVVDEILRRKVDTRWTAFFKPDEKLTADEVTRMRDSGLCAAEVGTDASTDTTLKKLGKPFKFREVVRTNDLFVEHGISPAHYLMFGCPGETEETVREGIANIGQLEAAAVFVFMGIRILPGTALAKLARRQGVLAEGDDLIEPRYYVSPGVDRDWMEAHLTTEFAKMRNVVFPPDALESALKMLHRMGFNGNAIDFLVNQARTAAGV